MEKLSEQLNETNGDKRPVAMKRIPILKFIYDTESPTSELMPDSVNVTSITNTIMGNPSEDLTPNNSTEGQAETPAPIGNTDENREIIEIIDADRISIDELETSLDDIEEVPTSDHFDSIAVEETPLLDSKTVSTIIGNGSHIFMPEAESEYFESPHVVLEMLTELPITSEERFDKENEMLNENEDEDEPTDELKDPDSTDFVNEEIANEDEKDNDVESEEIETSKPVVSKEEIPSSVDEDDKMIEGFTTSTPTELQEHTLIVNHTDSVDEGESTRTDNQDECDNENDKMCNNGLETTKSSRLQISLSDDSVNGVEVHSMVTDEPKDEEIDIAEETRTSDIASMVTDGRMIEIIDPIDDSELTKGEDEVNDDDEVNDNKSECVTSSKIADQSFSFYTEFADISGLLDKIDVKKEDEKTEIPNVVVITGIITEESSVTKKDNYEGQFNVSQNDHESEGNGIATISEKAPEVSLKDIEVPSNLTENAKDDENELTQETNAYKPTIPTKERNSVVATTSMYDSDDRETADESNEAKIPQFGVPFIDDEVSTTLTERVEEECEVITEDDVNQKHVDVTTDGLSTNNYESAKEADKTKHNMREAVTIAALIEGSTDRVVEHSGITISKIETDINKKTEMTVKCISSDSIELATEGQMVMATISTNAEQLYEHMIGENAGTSKAAKTTKPTDDITEDARLPTSMTVETARNSNADTEKPQSEVVATGSSIGIAASTTVSHLDDDNTELKNGASENITTPQINANSGIPVSVTAGGSQEDKMTEQTTDFEQTVVTANSYECEASTKTDVSSIFGKSKDHDNEEKNDQLDIITAFTAPETRIDELAKDDEIIETVTINTEDEGGTLADKYYTSKHNISSIENNATTGTVAGEVSTSLVTEHTEIPVSATDDICKICDRNETAATSKDISKKNEGIRVEETASTVINMLVEENHGTSQVNTTSKGLELPTGLMVDTITVPAQVTDDYFRIDREKTEAFRAYKLTEQPTDNNAIDNVALIYDKQHSEEFTWDAELTNPIVNSEIPASEIEEENVNEDINEETERITVPTSFNISEGFTRVTSTSNIPGLSEETTQIEEEMENLQMSAPSDGFEIATGQRNDSGRSTYIVYTSEPTTIIDEVPRMQESLSVVITSSELSNLETTDSKVADKKQEFAEGTVPAKSSADMLNAIDEIGSQVVTKAENGVSMEDNKQDTKVVGINVITYKEGGKNIYLEAEQEASKKDQKMPSNGDNLEPFAQGLTESSEQGEFTRTNMDEYGTDNCIIPESEENGQDLLATTIQTKEITQLLVTVAPSEESKTSESSNVLTENVRLEVTGNSVYDEPTSVDSIQTDFSHAEELINSGIDVGTTMTMFDEYSGTTMNPNDELTTFVSAKIKTENLEAGSSYISTTAKVSEDFQGLVIALPSDARTTLSLDEAALISKSLDNVTFPNSPSLFSSLVEENDQMSHDLVPSLTTSGVEVIASREDISSSQNISTVVARTEKSPPDFIPQSNIATSDIDSSELVKINASSLDSKQTSGISDLASQITQYLAEENLNYSSMTHFTTSSPIEDERTTYAQMVKETLEPFNEFSSVLKAKPTGEATAEGSSFLMDATVESTESNYEAELNEHVAPEINTETPKQQRPIEESSSSTPQLRETGDVTGKTDFPAKPSEASSTDPSLQVTRNEEALNISTDSTPENSSNGTGMLKRAHEFLYR